MENYNHESKLKKEEHFQATLQPRHKRSGQRQKVEEFCNFNNVHPVATHAHTVWVWKLEAIYSRICTASLSRTDAGWRWRWSFVSCDNHNPFPLVFALTHHPTNRPPLQIISTEPGETVWLTAKDTQRGVLGRVTRKMNAPVKLPILYDFDMQWYHIYNLFQYKILR